MTLGNAAAAHVRLIVRASIVAIMPSPIPPRWLLGVAPDPDHPSRLALAGSYSPCNSPVETVMMLSFAAPKLRGRALTAAQAAIMDVSL